MRDRNLSFAPEQLGKTAPATPASRTAPCEQWDPNFDEATEALFCRVWLDEDVRPATSMRLREVLGGALLGNLPRVDDLGLLLSVAISTRSEKLRNEAYSYLANWLTDGETVDYKTEIANLLLTLPMPPHWTHMPILMDKTRKAIEQYKTA